MKNPYNAFGLISIQPLRVGITVTAVFGDGQDAVSRSLAYPLSDPLYGIAPDREYLYTFALSLHLGEQSNFCSHQISNQDNLIQVDEFPEVQTALEETYKLVLGIK
jgi:hypothetical protein